LRGRDFLSIDDLSSEELSHLLAYAAEQKEGMREGRQPAYLAGRVLAMVFEKPSLRTRVTFEVGMWQLGGHAVYLGPQDIQMGARESVGDVAANLDRWVSGIMARTFAHRTQEELAAGAAIPVINGLSDLEHPCQVLADLLTMLERYGHLAGLQVAWVGDGNNVCHSLLLGCAKMGAHLAVATPPGYAPRDSIVARAVEIGGHTGARISVSTDPTAAVRGVDVVSTDVWTSMGQEAEREARRRIFAPYQLNAALLAQAGPAAVVMHCLPAHRGEEITDDVLDGAQSIVLDQAENRLHAQKALLALLL
jgi:ornithine carbamoyltransferase